MECLQIKQYKYARKYKTHCGVRSGNLTRIPTKGDKQYVTFALPTALNGVIDYGGDYLVL